MPPLRQGLTAIVWGMIGLHQRAAGLHRVLFEEAPRSAAPVATQDAYFERATAGIAGYLGKCPEVRVPDVGLAAMMVASVVDEITHGAVIRPRYGTVPEGYGLETVAMLEAYLMAERV